MQAAKSLAIARSYLEEEGLDFTCSPEFVHLALEGAEDRSALKIKLSKSAPERDAGCALAEQRAPRPRRSPAVLPCRRSAVWTAPS